jgi:transcriptional regulator with XRE-family HTH domain
LLVEEIKKCIVVCYNCHKEIHHINKSTKSQTNKKICLEFKKQYSCEKCGYDKCNEALEFHHNKKKKFPIGNFINNSIFFKSIEDIKSVLKKELEKCSVVCSNCHHDIHFDKEKFNAYTSFIDSYVHKEKPAPIDTAYFVQLYKEGLNQIEISKKLGCTKSTVSAVLKKAMGGNLSKTTLIYKLAHEEGKGHSKTLDEWVRVVLNKCVKTAEDCWLWPGRHNRDGYGSISFKSDSGYKEISTHRLIYEHFKGRISVGLFLRHECKNNNCCNPDHLFLSTPSELGKARIRKGQIFKAIGEKSGMCKITSEQVINIRADNRKLIEIAMDYGVAKSTISEIKNKKSRVNG